MYWTTFNGECTGRIQNDSKNTKIQRNGTLKAAAGKKRFRADKSGDEYLEPDQGNNKPKI